MDSEIVRQNEREFFVVYKALTRLIQSTPDAAFMQLELTWASETVRWLMREADCIDPSVVLDGTAHLGLAADPRPR